MDVLEESKATPIRCPDGFAHQWVYRGKTSQMYSCQRCAYQISKARLQEATN